MTRIQIDTEKLKQKSLFIATPMYGGNATGIYTNALSDLIDLCRQLQVDVKKYFMFNESLIPRARNYCVDEFLRSGYSHMMFIDADIGFNPKDVITLLSLCEEETGMDIVTGAYPKKTIAWEKISKAYEMGYGKENPFQLSEFVGDYVFNPVEGTTEFRIDQPVQIKEGGTGFMMIHRNVFTKYAEAYPDLLYKPDHVRTEHFDGSKKITAFFDCEIDGPFQKMSFALCDLMNADLSKEERLEKIDNILTQVEKEKDSYSYRYLSEDYMFCQRARKIDIKVWLCPWMRLIHAGSYYFGGSLQALAAIKATPTSNKYSNKKAYEKGFTSTPKESIVNSSVELTRQQRRAIERQNSKKQ
jgi:hypothetical protein